MHLRSNLLFPLIAAVVLVATATAQAPAPNTSGMPQFRGYDIPTPDDGSRPVTAPAATAPAAAAGTATAAGTIDTGDRTAPVPQAPNQPGATAQVPAGPRAPDRQSGDSYTFIATVREVMLNATVVDERNRLITSLDRNAFTVFENGQPQQITTFARRDIPVALGILVDNSGSMRDKRSKVTQAALNLVKASNPEDKVFVVNFNDQAWLDQDYTSNVPKLEEALDKIESRSGTAVYDAVVAAAEHLKGAPLEKKVLLVVTDGEDNASAKTLEDAIRALQVEGGPTVYTLGLFERSEGRQKRARRALQELAEQTGGVAFFPKDLSEVDAISQSVAHDIRNQYLIGYRPSTPQDNAGFRSVKVEARARGYNKLQVRTKSGYYAGQQQARR